MQKPGAPVWLLAIGFLSACEQIEALRERYLPRDEAGSRGIFGARGSLSTSMRPARCAPPPTSSRPSSWSSRTSRTPFTRELQGLIDRNSSNHYILCSRTLLHVAVSGV